MEPGKAPEAKSKAEVQMQGSVKKEVSQKPVAIQGLSQAAYDWVKKHAANTKLELPESTVAESTDFAIASDKEFKFAQSNKEAGEWFDAARQNLRKRMSRAFTQSNVWAKNAADDIQALSKLDQIESFYHMSQMRRELDGRYDEALAVGQVPTSEADLNKKIAQAVEVKFQAVKIELEDSIKEHSEATAKRQKTQTLEQVNVTKLELESQVNKINADLAGKIESTRGGLDKMIGVKVDAVVNESMKKFNLENITKLQEQLRDRDREVVRPPPRTAIGAAPASSAGQGSQAAGGAILRADSKARPCAFRDVRDRPLEELINHQEAASELVKLSKSGKVVELYVPDDYGSSEDYFNSQWYGEDHRVRLAKSLRSILAPKSRPGDAHPEINTTIDGQQLMLESWDRETGQKNGGSTVRFAGVPRYLDERDQGWPFLSLCGLLPMDASNPIAIGVNFSRDRSNPGMGIGDYSCSGVIFFKYQSTEMAELVVNWWNGAGKERSNSEFQYPFIEQLNPPIVHDKGENRRWIQASIARDEMARGSSQGSNRISSTRSGDSIYAWGPRQFNTFYDLRIPMSLIECRREVEEAIHQYYEERKITVKGFNDAGFAEP